MPAQGNAEMPAQNQMNGANSSPQKPKIEKENVTVKQAAGGITIAQLYSKKESFNNQTVKIKGQVTKVNKGIMDKNWIHLQDGTSSADNYDLTITTMGDFKTGDIVTFEGKISLKKDFGYGYYYEVIMENGIAK